MVGEAALEIRAPEHVGEVEHDQVAIKSELRPSSSRSLSVAQPQTDPDYLDFMHIRHIPTPLQQLQQFERLRNLKVQRWTV